MTRQQQEHWDHIWSQRTPDEMSWFQESSQPSLALITSLAADRDVPILDVGGGASPLVDELLDANFTDVTVLDLAESALAHARNRLGARAEHVTWVVGDATLHVPVAPVAIWHDRAVFHFLTDDADRDRYVSRVHEAVRPGGHVILATFGLDGPENCSGLPVRRHGRDDLAAALGEEFEAKSFVDEMHETPTGAKQSFLYGTFTRR